MTEVILTILTLVAGLGILAAAIFIVVRNHRADLALEREISKALSRMAI